MKIRILNPWWGWFLTVVAMIGTAPLNRPGLAEVIPASSLEAAVPSDFIEIPVVTLQAENAETSEPLPAALVVPGRFAITRTERSLELPLKVFLTYGGSASENDYEPLPREVVIPAGTNRAQILLRPRADLLVEGTETVVGKLVPATGVLTSEPASRSYAISSDHGTAEVRIHDEDEQAGLPVVRITATRPETSEPSATARFAPGEFTLHRSGGTTETLSVYLTYEGTATMGRDYAELKRVVVIPAGAAEASVLVQPIDDSIVEEDETVVAHLLASPVAGLPSYQNDPQASSAKVVIHDNEFQASATIKITYPAEGAVLPAGAEVVVKAVAVDPNGYIPRAEFHVDGALIGVSEIAFVQAPPNGTPIEHSVIWKNPAAGEHLLSARGKDSRGNAVNSNLIHVNVRGEGDAASVSISATDPSATELPPFADAIDLAHFEIKRSGLANEPLRVFFSVHGTATPGGDYAEIGTSVLIAAGASSATIQIVPKADLLTVIEPMETVSLRLEPSPLAGPRPTYEIDQKHAEAAGVIFEQRPPEGGAIELALPSSGAEFNFGAPISIIAAAVAPPQDSIRRVDFYADEKKVGAWEAQIGSAEQRIIFPTTTWKEASPGKHVLTARATLASGAELFSSRINLVVRGSDSPARIEITSPREGEVFPPGKELEISAVAIDPSGYIPRLEFYANDRLAGVSEIFFIRAPDPGTPIAHTIAWTNPPAGEFSLTARGLDSRGMPVVSRPVNISIRETLPSDQVVLSVQAVDAVATEASSNGTVDNAAS
ncbi:MAG TPA: Ig-like domain-containing protein [Verrucomicrobiae bacterium]|nr:Ig-like domain-containing protein [Verrucomicrobiae bacterium]